VKADKIYLVGFMAAGKTSLADALAARLSWRAEDIDQLIEARERLTIADIFARYGEPYFRTVEKEILRLVVPLRYTVVATGGGTFLDPDNRALINQDGVSVWIDVPFDVLAARIPTDGSRPLAADREHLARLFGARRIGYEQAHLRIDAAETATGELVEKILDWLETSSTNG
jgi:shikimate kinase